jgi:hypothetical protein
MYRRHEKKSHKPPSLFFLSSDSPRIRQTALAVLL